MVRKDRCHPAFTKHEARSTKHAFTLATATRLFILCGDKVQPPTKGACQVLRTSAKNRASTRLAYTERVNLAIDYMVSNLARPLRLEQVSHAAMLSPYHFHRVFRALMGETLGEFVKRLRLDRALAMMAHARRTPLTKIALACGFASSSDFSRCFRQRFGAAPSRFDLNSWRDEHRTELEATVPGRLHLKQRAAGPNPDRFKVNIRALPARTVAYIRVHDPYKGDGVPRAIRRLDDWAQRNGLADGQWLGYQWDNPEITALEDCVYHIAVEAERFTPRGEIGRFKFPPMTVAEVELCGTVELELRALQWLYGEWLPQSGFVPDDQPGFEAFKGRPLAWGPEYYELYAHLPVRPETA